jgi:hypothetical protein
VRHLPRRPPRPAIVYLRRYYTDATIDDDPRLSAFLEAGA